MKITKESVVKDILEYTIPFYTKEDGNRYVKIENVISLKEFAASQVKLIGTEP